jgi:hypothetical protein
MNFIISLDSPLKTLQIVFLCRFHINDRLARNGQKLSLVVRAIYCPFLFIPNLKPKTCRYSFGLKRLEIEIFKSYRMVCKFTQLDYK